MTESTKNEITKFLIGIGFGEWSVSDYFDPENYEKDIDFEHPYDSIIGHLKDNSAFETGEIIGYDSAMAFLQENDASMVYTLRYAGDVGYSIYEIDSEILANLLYSQLCLGSVEDREREIEEFFSRIRNTEEDL
jgi:hypothetical protein